MKSNQWLKDFRASKSLKQYEVAREAGIDRSYYTKIENGQTPSVRVAKVLGNILDFEWTKFFNHNCDDTSQNK
ncbi:helix-turn-helix transcriptional regulator [Bacillus altitudinis]|uniref:Helix-turn-helix transcriptional regulator n=1 Tax=Bacillus altitudinis TaxID=293387 RepID=A0ABV1S3C6_BACAB